MDSYAQEEGKEGERKRERDNTNRTEVLYERKLERHDGMSRRRQTSSVT
jgi:hypothetical protein